MLRECASAGVHAEIVGDGGGFGICRGIRGSRQPPGCLFALISVYHTVAAHAHSAVNQQLDRWVLVQPVVAAQSSLL